MKNEELLERLLVLVENQDKNISNLHGHISALNTHICKLEEFVAAQQRTIDTLASMAQPVVNIDNSKHTHTEHHNEHTGANVTTGTPNAVNMNVGK